MPISRLGEHTPQLQEGVWVADTATLIGDVHLARNVNVWFRAILRGDNDPISIGENTTIQDGSVLHTDDGVPLTIGSNVTVGHKVMLHGCTVRFERAARQAKLPGPGEKPQQVYWLKGTVAGAGDVIVDVLELVEE